MNDAFDLWIISRYLNADLTVGAADVDNRSAPYGAEVEIVDQVIHAVGRVKVGVVHGIYELLLPFGFLSDDVKRVLIGIVR